MKSCFYLAIGLFLGPWTLAEAFRIIQATQGCHTASSLQSSFPYRILMVPPPTSVRPAWPLYGFDKLFEESGTLGKGVTVGKLQVALTCADRKPDSIFGLLERNTKVDASNNYALARLCYDVCMAIMRKQDDWYAACSESLWFRTNDAGKAESQFNRWADKEAAKFEKEYMPDKNADEKPGGPTLVVVSIIIEIMGDETKFDGAGYSIAGTREVLSSLASDVLVADGNCVNAVEVFWTPGDRDETLTRDDLIVDFPELISL